MRLSLSMLLLAVCLPAISSAARAHEPIDRRALVERHTVVRTALDLRSPLSVGNGDFAFNADITGLQTFVAFNTLSNWGWHSGAPPAGTELADYREPLLDVHGRAVPHALPDPAQPLLSDWLASTPHRVNLGRLGLVLLRNDGQPAQATDLQGQRQELDLWRGLITSEFELDGEPVVVQTACHPRQDAVAVRIESPLLAEGRLGVFLCAPGNNPLAFAEQVGDWANPAPLTELSRRESGAVFLRRLDDQLTHYSLGWTGMATVAPQDAYGRIAIMPQGGSTFDLVCEFSPEPPAAEPATAAEVFAQAAGHWEAYWSSGAALDLSGSRDPRWRELERRIVLSQYLMAVHGGGSLPPQESGLLNNGWYGRFHFEMLWWHGAHFALWDRWDELDGMLKIYDRLLPDAFESAARQGFDGARWPKCTGPDGREWPHEIHALLLWQQPHPLFFAELDYRAHPTPETLARWAPVVAETADFMASYAHFDEPSQRYVLGPPLHVASENTDPYDTLNPTFELAYWRFGLDIAAAWWQRLGQPPEPKWADVRARLADLPMQDGAYVLHEGVADMWTRWNFEHPALAGAYGMLSGPDVDRAAMDRTFGRIMQHWDFERVWGWDFPLLAMTAARLGRPEQAVDLLLHESSRFQFDDAGLATGGPFPYFPSNGGLLYAVALMAGGWDGASRRHAPGFPADGSWSVRCEGFAPAP